MAESKTHWKKQMNKDFLGSYSIEGLALPVRVTIKKVGKGMVKSEHTEENKFTLWFEETYGEKNKPMICNVTNATFLEETFETPFIEDWIGKSVGLTIKKNIKAFGELVDALRFCEYKKPVAKKKPLLNPKSEKWDVAQMSVQQDGTSIAQIRKHYTITQKNFDLLFKKD